MPGAVASLPQRDAMGDFERPSTPERQRRHSLTAFRTVRAETERRAAFLSAEDQVVQSMPDASPTKWHRAHTTWFFEQFLLLPHAPGYRPLDERFAFLFNSYYVAAGPRYDRPKRGLVTRPDVAEVAAYRAHVDHAVERLIETADESALSALLPILEIGLHHVLLQPVHIARSLVTNAEWLEFMSAGGYRNPMLWLSDGWTTVQQEGWTAPGYWHDID